MQKYILLSLVLLSLSACARQEFLLNQSSSAGVNKHTKMQHFFIGGIGQTQEISTKEYCGTKDVAIIATERSVLDILINVFQGIYTPRTIEIHCKN
jgi:Bor protein